MGEKERKMEGLFYFSNVLKRKYRNRKKYPAGDAVARPPHNCKRLRSCQVGRILPVDSSKAGGKKGRWGA
jgi:hypothetical protein